MSRAPRAARKNWGSDDTDCHVLHIDMDCFFAAIEELDNPSLRGKPVVVGGSSMRGVVSAANYAARFYGINSAMPMARARACCPQAVFLPARMERYREVSQHVMKIIGDVSPVMEPVSVDEAFLDVRGALRRLGSPCQIATQLRTQIRRELGLAASIGVAVNKYVAKLASGSAKPDGLLLVPKAATVAFAQSVPLAGMWSVGHSTLAKLTSLGITTVEELAHTPLSHLAAALGQANAQRLIQLAWGSDDRSVETNRAEKSISTETTFTANVTDQQVLQAQLLAAAHDCAHRLRGQNLQASTVTLKIRYADFQTCTRSKTLLTATQLAREIYQEARRLWEGVQNGKAVRLLGVGVSNLTACNSGRQLSWDENPRQEKTEKALDQITSRFGRGTVLPAALLKTPRSGHLKEEKGPIDNK